MKLCGLRLTAVRNISAVSQTKGQDLATKHRGLNASQPLRALLRRTLQLSDNHHRGIWRWRAGAIQRRYAPIPPGYQSSSAIQTQGIRLRPAGVDKTILKDGLQPPRPIGDRCPPERARSWPPSGSDRHHPLAIACRGHSATLLPRYPLRRDVFDISSFVLADSGLSARPLARRRLLLRTGHAQPALRAGPAARHLALAKPTPLHRPAAGSFG